MKSEAVENFWKEFCRKNPDVKTLEPYQVWFFGNEREMARQLGKLVLAGKKKATTSLVLINEMKPEMAPIEDGYSVVTEFDGDPLCVIRTTGIRHVPFAEVDAQFAFNEGEDDQTLESWRAVHLKYFTRECAELNITFDESMLVACERFELVYPEARNEF